MKSKKQKSSEHKPRPYSQMTNILVQVVEKNPLRLASLKDDREKCILEIEAWEKEKMSDLDKRLWLSVFPGHRASEGEAEHFLAQAWGYTEDMLRIPRLAWFWKQVNRLLYIHTGGTSREADGTLRYFDLQQEVDRLRFVGRVAEKYGEEPNMATPEEEEPEVTREAVAAEHGVRQEFKRGASEPVLYATTVKKLRISEPTFKELEEATGTSAATWNRRFNELAWLVQLKDTLHSWQGHRRSKTRQMKQLFYEAESVILARIKTFKTDTNQQNEEGARPLTQDPYADTKDVIDEESNRGNGEAMQEES